MIPEQIFKLKKYLFLISILIFLISASHLIYIFLYNDAKLEPIAWGKISEWLIGNIPSLNPLIPQSWNNKYIVGLLYRSLLGYNIQEEKIDSDLASCDISNLFLVECFIKDNIYFSDGSSITQEDIIATYKVLQNTNINPIIKSILTETTITSSENTITFSNEKRDLNFINVLFQPIISKKIIDTLWETELEWSFSTVDQVYSWDFNIINIEQNLSLGITKLILEKNIYSENKNLFIDQFEIKFFPDTANFLKNKDIVNIFNDKYNLIGTSIPRFQAYQYTLPQYVSLFINQNNITNQNLRNFILNEIPTDQLIQSLWEDQYANINNPYINDFDISNKEWKKLDELLAKQGYYKKSKHISDYIPEKNTSTYTDETNIEEIIPEEISIDDFQKKSDFIVSPIYIDRYNSITKDDILLKWLSDPGTTAVYINDYKLQSYNSWDRFFYYRLKTSYDNINTWENNYQIYFEKNWIKEAKEKITILYDPNKLNLDIAEKELVQRLYQEEQEKKKEEESKVLVEKTEEDKDKIADKIEKFSDLDDTFFYNDDLQAFSLNLYYLSTESDIEKTSLFIKEKLEKIWIKIILRPIALGKLSEILVNKDQYDLILAGINLWYFDSNIFHYFHSSQAKNWYNFSNTRRTSLDIILEDLKSTINIDEKYTLNKTNALKILKEEQVIKTLYTPKIHFLVDKNIKNTQFKEYIPNKDLRYKILNNAYIKEKNIINFKNKKFTTFIQFLFKKFNEQ